MKTKIILILILFFSTSFAQIEEWINYSYMELPVSNAEALVHNNTIYVLGGYSDSLQRDARIMQMFSPESDSWNALLSLSSPRMDFVADIYYDSIYFFGGEFQYWEATTDNELATFAIERMDLNGNVSDAYHHHALFKRTGATGHIHGDNFYIFGGNVKADTVFSFNPYAVVYNIPQKEITTMLDTLNYDAELPSWQISEIVGDDIYIFGGVSYGVSNKIWKYNTNTNTLTTLPINLSIPRAGGDAVYRPQEQAIYIIGGFNESESALRTVEKFYIDGGNYRIESAPDLNIPRAHCSAVYWNNQIFVMGGYNTSKMLSGTIEIMSFTDLTDVESEGTIPNEFMLEQNFPNPFNPATTISFRLPEATFAELRIYSATGELVNTLFQSYLQSGTHSFVWNGKMENGLGAPSGIYLYQLRAGKFIENKKMMLLR